MLQRVWIYTIQVNAPDSIVEGCLDVFDRSPFPLDHMTNVQAFALGAKQMIPKALTSDSDGIPKAVKF